MGVLGVGEGQWVNGGIEKGQVRVNGGIEKGQWALVGGGIGQGQWGY